MKKVRSLHIVLAFILSSPALLEAQQTDRPKIDKGTLEKVQEKGTVRVMVMLNVPAVPEGHLSEPEKVIQRNSIAAAKKTVVAELTGTKFKVIREFDAVPLISLEVDANALSVLETSNLVKSVSDKEFRPVKRHLTESVPLIGRKSA